MEKNIKTAKKPYLRPVVTLIIYNNGKILLQKRDDNGCWAIHGGGIELGEQYIDTLNREIQEELNIKPINPELMGIYSGEDLFNIYPKSKDQVYILNHVFFCENYEGKIRPITFNGQLINYDFFREKVNGIEYMGRDK